MRGEAVPQGVRMNLLVGKPGTLGGRLAGRPQNLGCHGSIPCVPRISGKQPHFWLVLECAPVVAQSIEQPGAEHHIAIPVALATVDVNDHAPAVDILDLQMRRFRPPCTCAIEGHQHRAVKGAVGSIDQAGDLFRTEDVWQSNDPSRIWRLGHAPVLLQYLDIEEPESSQTLNDGVRVELQLAEQHRLILADMLRTELIRTSMKVSAEVLDSMDIGTDRVGREVATLQLLNHELT